MLPLAYLLFFLGIDTFVTDSDPSSQICLKIIRILFWIVSAVKLCNMLYNIFIMAALWYILDFNYVQNSRFESIFGSTVPSINILHLLLCICLFHSKKATISNTLKYLKFKKIEEDIFTSVKKQFWQLFVLLLVTFCLFGCICIPTLLKYIYTDDVYFGTYFADMISVISIFIPLCLAGMANIPLQHANHCIGKCRMSIEMATSRKKAISEFKDFCECYSDIRVMLRQFNAFFSIPLFTYYLSAVMGVSRLSMYFHAFTTDDWYEYVAISNTPILFAAILLIHHIINAIRWDNEVIKT